MVVMPCLGRNDWFVNRLREPGGYQGHADCLVCRFPHDDCGGGERDLNMDLR